MENVSKTIKRHNKRVTKINERFVAPRNYRDNCPMNGSCRVQKVVYVHVVSVTEKSKEHAYTKVAEGNWKQRYYNYTMAFRNQRHKNDTAFSSFLWELKKSLKETPNLIWSVVKVPAFSSISKHCLPCLNEDQKQLLNKKRYAL